MNTVSSNGENGVSKTTPPPHIGTILRQLRQQGGLNQGAIARFVLLRIPKLAVLLGVFYLISELALMQPLRKALFSWREGLAFSYGDFILFFLISCVLALALAITLWRWYRQECALLYLCNFGVAAQHYRFDERLAHYHYSDAAGNEHQKLFVQDYIHLYPFARRLVEDSRAALPNLHVFASDGAKRCAEEIASGKQAAQVYYLPAQPQQSQLVTQGAMQEYFWRA